MARSTDRPGRTGRPKGGGKRSLTATRKLPVNLKHAPTRARLRARLMDAFSAGSTIDTACAYAGLSETALRGWWEGDDDFAQACVQARETGIMASLTTIQIAARQGDWKAAEAFLRLVKPSEYGGPKTVVNANTTTNTTIDQRAVIVEQVLDELETFIPDADTRYRLGVRLLEGHSVEAGDGIGIDPFRADGSGSR